MEKSSWCINYFAYLWMCFSCHVLIYAYVWLQGKPALSFHIMSNNELSSVSNAVSLNSWQFIVYLPRDVWWKLNFNCLRVVMRRLCARAQPSNFPFLLAYCFLPPPTSPELKLNSNGLHARAQKLFPFFPPFVYIENIFDWKHSFRDSLWEKGLRFNSHSTNIRRKHFFATENIL